MVCDLAKRHRPALAAVPTSAFFPIWANFPISFVFTTIHFAQIATPLF